MGLSPNPSVLEIVKHYLETDGCEYDGLFNADADCACLTEKLAACGDIMDCRCGWKVPCDCGEHTCHISLEKPE